MQINPFYPARSAAAAALWHDNDECGAGQSIFQAHRLPGIGTGTTHCACCAALNHPLRPPCLPPASVAIVWTHTTGRNAARNNRRRTR